MLAVRGVTKAYGARRVLTSVSFTVMRGEVVLLVGRNGAGKTTLLRIVTGFLDPDGGSVTVDGVAMSGERGTAQSRLGYLPEHAPGPAELTAAEHLHGRARLKGCRSGAEAAAAVDRAAAIAAVTDVLPRRIGNLSKGYRQRIGLADALLGDPPLLVLDEPTSGMDPIQVKELREHLQRIAVARAVLVSSHAVADLRALATRVAVLRSGVLVACDTPEALLARTGCDSLEAAVIELLDERLPAAGRPDAGAGDGSPP